MHLSRLARHSSVDYCNAIATSCVVQLPPSRGCGFIRFVIGLFQQFSRTSPTAIVVIKLFYYHHHLHRRICALASDASAEAVYLPRKTLAPYTHTDTQNARVVGDKQNDNETHRKFCETYNRINLFSISSVESVDKTRSIYISLVWIKEHTLRPKLVVPLRVSTS